MKRVGITIILNGLEHLKHKDYYKTLLNMFDYLIIIEGAANNTGSTSWCKKMPNEFHNNGASIDGTIEFLTELAKENSNLIFIKSNGLWENKDVMINTGIDILRTITNKCYLWIFGIDEQWTEEQLINSENELVKENGKIGLCQFNHFVGDNIIAVGEWGGNYVERLWLWEGEKFLKHEPQIIDTPNYITVKLTEKFNHYSYFFENDVKFKDKWYSGHEGVYENWLKLKKETNFPQNITYLFPYWNRNRGELIKI